MPYLHLIDEAIGLLNTEIRLIEWRIKYPEQLQQRTNKQPLSPLYLANKTTLINIMEVISAYSSPKTSFIRTANLLIWWTYPKVLNGYLTSR